MRLDTYLGAALTAALFLSTTALAGGKHHHEDFYARNLKTITSIYNLTVFPSTSLSPTLLTSTKPAN